MRRAWLLGGLTMLSLTVLTPAYGDDVLVNSVTSQASHPDSDRNTQRREPSIITANVGVGGVEHAIVTWINFNFDPVPHALTHARINVSSATLSQMIFGSPLILEPTLSCMSTPDQQSTGDPFMAVDPNADAVYIAGISRCGLDSNSDTTALSMWRWCGDSCPLVSETICSPGGGNGFVDKPSIAVRAYVDGGGAPHSTIYVAHMLAPQSGEPYYRIHVHKRESNSITWTTLVDVQVDDRSWSPMVLVDPSRKDGDTGTASTKGRGEVYVAWLNYVSGRIYVARKDETDGTPAGEWSSTPWNVPIAPEPMGLPCQNHLLGPPFFSDQLRSEGTFRARSSLSARYNPIAQKIGLAWHQESLYNITSCGSFEVDSKFVELDLVPNPPVFGPVKAIAIENDHKNQFHPAVAVDPNGDYVLTYYDTLADSNTFGLSATLISARNGDQQRLDVPINASDPATTSDAGGYYDAIGEYHTLTYASRGRWYAAHIQLKKVTPLDNSAPYPSGNVFVSALSTDCTSATTFTIDMKSPMNSCQSSRTPVFKVHSGARIDDTSLTIWDSTHTNPRGQDRFTFEWSNGTTILGTGTTLDFTPSNSTTVYLRVMSKDDGTCDEIPVAIQVDSTPGTGTFTACVKSRNYGLSPSSVNPGDPVNMSITPSAGETYRWFRSNAGTTDQLFATGANATDDPMLNTTYSVEVDDGVGFEKFVVGTVTVCSPPSVRLPADRTIAQNTSTTISSTVSGATQYQWYIVSGGAASPISGQTAPSITVTPSQTTTYRLTVTNSCGSASDDIVIIVTSPPSVPVMFGATYNAATGNNEVSWSPSSSSAGIDHYVIERMPDNLTMTAPAQYTTIYDQYNVVAGRTYVYRVKAVDVNNIASAFSARDLTTRMAFTDDPIRAPNDNGGTLIRGVHIAELRRAVDAVRATASLGTAWTDYSAPTGPVAAAQFIELRDRLNEGRRVFALPDMVFSVNVDHGELIRGISLKELRDGVK